MPVPNFINDGDWGLRIPMNVDFEFPFSDKGDNTTFRAAVKFRMDKGAYRPAAQMSVFNFTLGQAYLTRLGSQSDLGCNICEFTDTYSSVPATRTEYGTYAYTQQWWTAIGDSGVDPDKYFYTVNFDIEEQTFTVAADVVYEYFPNTPPPPLIKPRVFLLFGFLQTIGGTPTIGQRIIAEDSTVEIYEGKIFCRRTIYARTRQATPVT